MKLSSLLNIMVIGSEAGGPRRPKVIMDNAQSLGRSVGPDRFIFQWPQCSDMTCGRPDGSQEKAEALSRGCLIRPNDKDYIQQDAGFIQYPQNPGDEYGNAEKCIWQIKTKTPNKFLKVSRFPELFGPVTNHGLV